MAHLARPQTDGPRNRAPRRRAPLGVESLESRMLLSGVGTLPWAPSVPIGATAPVSLVEKRAIADPSPRGHFKELTAANLDGAPLTVAQAPHDSGLLVSVVKVQGLAFRPAGLETPTAPPAVKDAIRTIPDGDEATVRGRIDPDSSVEVYRVGFRAGERTMEFDVSMPEGADPSVWERFWLLGASGDVLFHAPMPGPGGRLSVRVDSTAGDGGPAPMLMLGISRDGSLSTAPGDFLIHVGRVGGPAQSSGVTTPSASGAVAIGGPLSRWLIAPRGADDRGPDQAVSASDAGLALPVETAGLPADGTSSLPLRSAGPAAGVLADGRPTPPVGRGDGAVVDLTLIDLATPG